MNDACGRFFIAKDMNGDLAFTVTDVWLIAKYIYLLPAKAVVGVAYDIPQLATFFEIDCSTGEGIGGAVFSTFAWLIIMAILGLASDR